MAARAASPRPPWTDSRTQGVRFTNFNVEYSCIVSRIALLTGRYGLRTGDGLTAGMTLWEVTIAEALRSIGYATGIYGKWHVGGDNWKGRREPTQQGFDEWYGIPDTSHTAQFTSFEGFDAARNEVPYIWEAKAGELSRKVKPYNLETRRTIDREAAERGIAFMERNVKEGRPFFFYYPMTQIHFPALPHPDKAGTTGAGDIGDAMADVDYNVSLVLESIERLGIAENTLLIFCGDNGAEMRRPWRGAARHGRAACCNRLDCRISPTGIPGSFRVECANASRFVAPFCPMLGSCSWTSPSARSTHSPAIRSISTCKRCGQTSGQPHCLLPTA